MRSMRFLVRPPESVNAAALALFCRCGGVCHHSGSAVRHSAGTGFAFVPLALRAALHSSKRWITTNSDGTNSTARQVEAIMPVNTVMPIDLRALAPVLVAITSGTTHRIKEHEAFRI